MVEPFRFAPVAISREDLMPKANILDEVREALRVLARASDDAQHSFESLVRTAARQYDARVAEVLGVPVSALTGVRVHLASAMPDGRVYVAQIPPLGPGPDETVIFIGTYRRPAAEFRPSLDDIAEEARLIVRSGMADELAWLGQDPEWLGTTEQVLRLLRDGPRVIPVAD